MLHLLVEAVSVIAAVLAGNWLGGAIRSSLTGQPAQSIRFQHTTAEGRTIRNIPVVTKFYPALFAGFLGKPRWFYAFLGGLAAGALVDDRFERLFWQRFEKVLLSSGKSGESRTETGEVAA